MGTPSRYLCSLNQTGYEQYANLMGQVEDASEGVAYRAQTDERACQRPDAALVLTNVLARQASHRIRQLVVTRWPYNAADNGRMEVKLDQKRPATQTRLV